ncbi:NAD(P)H-dependent amine dehydrogenase family protein [Mycobacterium asiaticum]|uniref:NAD(P)H-dependent amine dehydrogenase family protein n=1 Tax=Mycobacterium asiaticum TaxID=1790 RepID=UPI00056A9450|nr:dihydrodipicolinate reductase [Mycobacterium asiaticum]OBI87556.1 dihydrodipicolinate reductase [Mycobacterium asiaticum]ORA18730.1 dihydrodipicolinate reductase [Mycobacterium asiaticum DSM 44297]
MDTEPRLRVIQWATGAVGTEMVTTILDHRPDIELVGARVYSNDKCGVDIGTLVGREPIGVTATTDVGQILALDADLVLYAPSFSNLDDVCALLASGKNVAAVSFLFHPNRLPDADRARLLAACQKGNSTIHASGLNPGNLSGVLPLALSGMSRTIDRFTLQERADWSLWESTDITFDGMWFGRPIEDITPTANDFLTFNTALFTQQTWFIADTLHAAIDDVRVTVDAVPASKDFQIFDHAVQAGTTAGQRWQFVGHRNGDAVIEFETLWTVGGEYPEHWPKPQDGWTLTLEGDPSMRVHYFCLASYSRPASIEEHVRAGLIAVALQVVNAIAAVCAAPPGFATMADLPLIRSYTGFGDRRSK